MDIVPTDVFVPLSVLEEYIEKHPEDAEKWLEFIDIPEEKILPRRIYGELNEELVTQTEELHRSVPEIQVESYTEGCLYCRKSWISTEGVPKMTLLCGHSFHTSCCLLSTWYNDATQCAVEGCDINTYDYIRHISRTREQVKTKAENILLNSYKKRPDFKKDVNELKEMISTVCNTHASVRKQIADARKDTLHKHIFSIRSIQNDMNESVDQVRNSEQMLKFKTSVKIYRKKAAFMFRKYHVSFRDLHHQGTIRASWRIRSILERHQTGFSYHRMGFRLYPGAKLWKDPLG